MNDRVSRQESIPDLDSNSPLKRKLSKFWSDPLFALFGIVLAGVIGFFSSSLQTMEKISSLSAKIVLLEFQSKKFEAKIDKTTEQIIALDRSSALLELRVITADQNIKSNSEKLLFSAQAPSPSTKR